LCAQAATSLGTIFTYRHQDTIKDMLTGFKIIFSSLKRGFSILKHKDPLILSSSTAFFATFSLSPIIVIIVSLFQLYSHSGKVRNQLFRSIGATFGKETAKELESIVNNFLALESNWWLSIVGLVFFCFVATTLLGVVKHNIQKIWQIKPKSSLRWRYHSQQRGTQLALIIFTGILFGLSYLMETSLGRSLDYLQATWPAVAIEFVRFLNVLFSVVIATVWFMVVLKVLPDASISWDTAFTGGFFTAVLFSIGKIVLGKILVHARMETIFGASASFALLLLFIFYCSFILYYGAAFTHAYSEMLNNRICAGKYSDEYEERIIEANSALESLEQKS
jgi:membrane protein